MDRAEATKLAQDVLSEIGSDGYAVAAEHIETTNLSDLNAPSGKTYEVEVSYVWQNEEHTKILVICRVTSKSWFSHEHLEESLVLSEEAT